MAELIKPVPFTAVQVHVFAHANAHGHVFLCQIVLAERYHAYGQYGKRGYGQITRRSLVSLKQSLCGIEKSFRQFGCFWIDWSK